MAGTPTLPNRILASDGRPVNPEPLTILQSRKGGTRMEATRRRPDAGRRNVIFRPYIRINGVVYNAKDYGLKAFPIYLDK